MAPGPGRIKALFEAQNAAAHPPSDPAELASQNPAQGLTFATTTLDSFKKEVSVKLSFDFQTHCPGPTWHDTKAQGSVLSLKNSEYIYNISLAYDDQWKDGAPALSTLSQNYSGLAIHLSRLLSVPTTLLASEYHNNQQGVVLEQEYGIGLNGRFVSGTVPALDGSANGKIKRTFIISGGVRGAFDKLINTGTSPTFGPGIYLQGAYLFTSKAGLTGSFKGYAPFGSPLVNGRASVDVKYSYTLSCQWSASAEITDTYFATVPTGYRPNSLSTSLGLKFDPSKPSKLGTTGCPK